MLQHVQPSNNHHKETEPAKPIPFLIEEHTEALSRRARMSTKIVIMDQIRHLPLSRQIRTLWTQRAYRVAVNYVTNEPGPDCSESQPREQCLSENAFEYKESANGYVPWDVYP